ncbi:hypothetical protein TNCV_563761 [Trichonephila clavipes]|nr:hypothetical protein TNCV_563761 [Trichonephila clavipes]
MRHFLESGTPIRIPSVRRYGHCKMYDQPTEGNLEVFYAKVTSAMVEESFSKFKLSKVLHGAMSERGSPFSMASIEQKERKIVLNELIRLCSGNARSQSSQ